MKLISSKRFIGEAISDLSIDVTEYIDRIYAWIDSALGQIGLVSFYPLTRQVIEIANHKGKLPCNFQFVHSLWGVSGCNGGLGYINLSGSPFIGDVDGYTSIGNRGSIEGNFVHTDLKEGKLLLVYRAVPKDDQGFPMIPDNAFLNEALLYYIIYRLGFSGIQHPIIKMGDAYDMWEKLYPRAGNDIEWFDLSQMEEFKRMWTNNLAENGTDNLYIN